MTAESTSKRGLTQGEIETYRRDGLVIPDYRIPEGMLSRLQAALETVIEANPGVRGERLIGAHVEKNHDGLRGDRAFLDLALDDGVLDMVEAVLGPDIILWSTHIFAKPAGDGKEVPWHQDGHYWPIRPLATCSVWVALDDVTVENGAMRYVPGSHAERKLFSHHTDDRESLAINQVLDAANMDESLARDDVLEAGQLSLHDVYLIHGSPPNRSSRRRAGMVLRYMPATSLFDRTVFREDSKVDYSRMPIFLARGVDRHGGNDFTIGH